MSQDEATMDEVTIHRVEPTEDAEEDFNPFDDLADEYRPGPILKVEASDGLPTQHVPQSESDIPVLSPETLVCMGVFDEFVLRDQHRRIRQKWDPKDVKRLPSGDWYVTGDQTNEAIQADIKNSLKMDSVASVVVLVEPIRPPCKHYIRQSTQFDYNPQARHYSRLCAARRTTEGTFMSVSNRGMYACTMRSPRDMETEQTLDDFDNKKIAQGKQRVYLPIKA